MTEPKKFNCTIASSDYIEIEARGGDKGRLLIGAVSGDSHLVLGLSREDSLAFLEEVTRIVHGSTETPEAEDHDDASDLDDTEERIESLETTTENLTDDVAYLTAELAKLRAEVNGALRQVVRYGCGGLGTVHVDSLGTARIHGSAHA